MISCTRKLWFCAGHRVKGHEGKCRHLHGHNYIVYITAQAELDSIGRVIDFSILKQKFGDYIDKNFDHGFLLWDIDREAIESVSLVGRQKLFLLPYNPTAENIAKFLLEKSAEILGTDEVRVTSVKIYETENCFAEATA